MEIFDIVKNICDDRGISLSALERDLGFSRGSIYKMVNSAPSSDKVKKLAEYLDVSADCLLGISKVDTSEKAPTYDYLLKTFAKGKSNLTLEEKTKLVQMILSDKN